MRKPARPGVDFDVSDLKKREVDDFVKNQEQKVPQVMTVSVISLQIL